MIFSHNCIWNCFKISTIPKWTYCQFIFSMECFIYLCFCYLIWTEYLNCSSLNVKLWYLLWFLLVILLSCFKICFLQISITFIMSPMFFYASFYWKLLLSWQKLHHWQELFFFVIIRKWHNISRCQMKVWKLATPSLLCPKVICRIFRRLFFKQKWMLLLFCSYTKD